MKKRKAAVWILALAFLLLPTGTSRPVRADAIADYYPDDHTVDYYIQVFAPDGGVNFRYGPGVEYGKILSSMIPNGQTLHVYREAQASNGNDWAYVSYAGYYGWVALSQCIVVSEPQAASSGSGQAWTGGKDYFYSENVTHTDYNVQVSAPDGELNLRYGADVDYDRLMDYAIPNGTRLHIYFTAPAANGNDWGFTSYQSMNGWVALSQTTRLTDSKTPKDLGQDILYHVRVTAPDGGVNLRAGAGTDYQPLLSYLIPNETRLEITQENQAANGNYWGYTAYDTQKGYVTLNQVMPLAEKLSQGQTGQVENKTVGDRQSLNTQEGKAKTSRGSLALPIRQEMALAAILAFALSGCAAFFLGRRR